MSAGDRERLKRLEKLERAVREIAAFDVTLGVMLRRRGVKLEELRP